MADVPVSYGWAAKRGTPAFEALDTFTQQQLLASAHPPLGETVRILMASNMNFPAFAVVGLDANKALVWASWNAVAANGITPIGVVFEAMSSGANNTTKHAEVFLTGDFNAGSDSPLVWDASFDTLVKKTTARTGSPNLMFRSRRATGTPGA